MLGGESYPALANGLERALRLLGWVPREHRSDSLSAAFRNLAMPDADDLTRRFEALVAHFGMLPTRNNRGIAHENGAIESRNGHIKKRFEQAAAAARLPPLRRSRGLSRLRGRAGGPAQPSPRRRHRRRARRVAAVAAINGHDLGGDDRSRHQRVPASCAAMSSTPVPSRLIGHRLQLRIHDDRIEAHLGGSFVLSVPRGRRAKGAGPVHVVDYRHIIAALRAKPGALANLAYRRRAVAARRVSPRLGGTDRRRPGA